MSDDKTDANHPFWQEIRDQIEGHRRFLDDEKANGKLQDPKPYLSDGSEIFVVRVRPVAHADLLHVSDTPLGVLVDSPQPTTRKFVTDPPEIESYRKHVFGAEAVGYAFATLHAVGPMLRLRIEKSLEGYVGAPTAEDFERDLRFLVGPQHAPKPTEELN